jgi:hypothetical protein
VSATCPYPEPVQSSPYSYTPLPGQRISPGLRLSLAKGSVQVWGFLWPRDQSKFEAFFGQRISPSLRLSLWIACNMIRFCGEKLLATRPSHKLEDHSLSAVRDCSCNILAATLHTGDRSSVRNLKTRRSVWWQWPAYHGSLLILQISGGCQDANSNQHSWNCIRKWQYRSFCACVKIRLWTAWKMNCDRGEEMFWCHLQEVKKLKLTTKGH